MTTMRGAASLDKTQKMALRRFLNETVSLNLPPNKRAALDNEMEILWPLAFGFAFPYARTRAWG